MMAPEGSDSQQLQIEYKSEKMLKPETKRSYETDLSPEELSSPETSQQQIWQILSGGNMDWLQTAPLEGKIGNTLYCKDRISHDKGLINNQI